MEDEKMGRTYPLRVQFLHFAQTPPYVTLYPSVHVTSYQRKCR